MRELLSAISGASGCRLDVAALELASIEFPSLDATPYLARLDDMAAELAGQTAGSNGAEFVAAANTYFFHDIGFRGNESDYYDPKNSCLNWVLDHRTGIPITLSLVYLEVARRAGRPMSGVGLPGHFVIRYDDGQFSTFVDAFNGGRLLHESDCLELAQAAAGEGVVDRRWFKPVDTRYIIVRMLHNLRAAYFRREDFGKGVAVLDLLIQSSPETAEHRKARGIANIQLRRFGAAKADLERYLRLDPQAADREDIVKQLAAIHRWLGSLN